MVMIKIYGSTIQISFVKEGKERFFTVNLLGSYPSKIIIHYRSVGSYCINVAPPNRSIRDDHRGVDFLRKSQKTNMVRISFY